MTCRDLYARYVAICRQAWDHTSAMQATIHALATGESIDPDLLNPYRVAVDNRPPATQAEYSETASVVSGILSHR